jgi:hypothetical protein
MFEQQWGEPGDHHGHDGPASPLAVKGGRLAVAGRGNYIPVHRGQIHVMWRSTLQQ